VKRVVLVVTSALALSLVLVGAQGLLAGTTAVTFGAKLTKSSQPANAESGRSCANEGLPASACSWVSVEAYHNGGHERAPKLGTIGKVKLVSCVAGSFRLQLARVKPGTKQARVVRNGPIIRYSADPRHVDADDETFCGGEDGKDYVIQTFSVNVPVNKGDYVAIRAARTGALYCAGGNGVLLFSPQLTTGGGYRRADGDTSCNLLVQLQYK
jgi:hypothetical protein